MCVWRGGGGGSCGGGEGVCFRAEYIPHQIDPSDTSGMQYPSEGYESTTHTSTVSGRGGEWVGGGGLVDILASLRMHGGGEGGFLFMFFLFISPLKKTILIVIAKFPELNGPATLLTKKFNKEVCRGDAVGAERPGRASLPPEGSRRVSRRDEPL